MNERFRPVGYSCYGEYSEDDKIDDIEYARGLYQEQVHKVKREERILELLLEDYICVARTHKSRYDYINIFEDAQKQVGKKTKKERPQLETIRGFILEDFLNNDKKFKLTGLVACGYETYGWNVEFTGYGKSFYIYIPIMANITSKNFKSAREGKFAFSVETAPHVWSVLKSSYKITEIADFIKKYFEAEREKEE